MAKRGPTIQARVVAITDDKRLGAMVEVEEMSWGFRMSFPQGWCAGAVIGDELNLSIAVAEREAEAGAKAALTVVE